MSRSTWTRTALQSEFRPYEDSVCRLVDGRRVVSSMKLVGNPTDQAEFGNDIEPTKPRIPKKCRHPASMLFSPFRHEPCPGSSRIRRADPGAGVRLGTDHIETDIAKMAFYRTLILSGNPEIHSRRCLRGIQHSRHRYLRFFQSIPPRENPPLIMTVGRTGQIIRLAKIPRMPPARPERRSPSWRRSAMPTRARTPPLPPVARSRSQVLNPPIPARQGPARGSAGHMRASAAYTQIGRRVFASDPRIRDMNWSGPMTGPAIA